MTGLVEEVRNQINQTCIKNGNLRKNGCKVLLSGIPQAFLVIDLDNPEAPKIPGNKNCDYLFVGESSEDDRWVVPMELKGGEVDASQVVKQIRASARDFESMIPEGLELCFCPILAFGKHIHRTELKKIKKNSNRIRFLGYSEPIRLIRCGGRLAEGLAQCRRQSQ